MYRVNGCVREEENRMEGGGLIEVRSEVTKIE